MILPDFPIVDSHVHLYDPKKLSYPWISAIPLLQRAYLSKDYSDLTAPVKVESLVFVEVDVAEGQQLDEARFVHDLAKTDKRIKAMVASMPLERGARAVEADIATYAKMPLARGVRRLVERHLNEPGWCLQPSLIEAVKILPKYGLTFDLCLLSPQFADALEFVRRCPDVTIVLDHIAKPRIREGIREPWWGQMKELARAPNVWCKMSGVTTEADHKAWTYEQVAPYMSHAIECFGFDRMMFGGDWPVSELATPYPRWVETVDRVIAGASPEEKRKLYRDTATAFYRL
jgi:L-fuconolactonase